MIEPLISVIVPIYNVENYLTNCIDSIINQTYKNLEIILINDGSTDNCGRICDEYSLIDKRIKVIHKQNEGVSIARNVGIDISEGEYVAFVDSDDYVFDDYIKVLFNAIMMHEADMSICSYATMNMCDRKKKNKKSHLKCSVISSEIAVKKMLNFELVQGVVCKLFKSKCIKELQFKKYTYAEDLLFSVEFMLKQNKIVIVNQDLYCYITREDSVINGGFKYHKYKSLKAFDDILLLTNDIHLRDFVISRLVSAYFSILLEIPKSQYPLEYNIMIKKIKECRVNVLKTKGVRLKTKFACVLSYLGFDFVKLVFGVFCK